MYSVYLNIIFKVYKSYRLNPSVRCPARTIPARRVSAASTLTMELVGRRSSLDHLDHLDRGCRSKVAIEKWYPLVKTIGKP